MNFLSPAQCAGYLAFVVGILAFMQKNDQRLRFLNASQSLIYTLHFILLGNLAASASSAVSGVRSLLAMRTRSPILAVSILIIGILLGHVLVQEWYGWLPVIASSIATVAVFYLDGVAMRLVLLTSTLLWLTNNIFSGSIGGTLLELTVAIVNLSTIIRLHRERLPRPRAGEVRPGV